MLALREEEVERDDVGEGSAAASGVRCVEKLGFSNVEGDVEELTV